MSVERNLIIDKLLGFLTGEISNQEIYQWALSVAVSGDYEKLIKSNPLNEYILQFLIEIDKTRPYPAPKKKIVEYFVECLENKRTFNEAEYLRFFNAQSAKASLSEKSSQPIVPVSEKRKSPDLQSAQPAGQYKTFRETLLTKIAQSYVLFFILGSIVLNILAIVKPDFLVREGELPPLPSDVLRDAFPHLFYGITMIIALFLRGPKVLFVVFFFIATWGMFYYWYCITVFVFENKWPLYYLFMLSPLLTLPPTMMFLIMLNRWFFPAGSLAGRKVAAA